MAQLTTNTTGLQTILSAVNALPEAGSGGATVDTCTFTITGGGCIMCATTFEDGEFAVLKYTADDMATSIDNVVCKTMVFIRGAQSADLILSNCSFADEISGPNTLYTGVVIDQGATDATVTVSGGVDEPPGKG